MAFIDQGTFEAMKMLSGWEAARCDEHQFRAKIKVSTWVVFELSLIDKWSEQRKKTKKGTFATTLHGFWLLAYMSLADHKRTQEEHWAPN